MFSQNLFLTLLFAAFERSFSLWCGIHYPDQMKKKFNHAIITKNYEEMQMGNRISTLKNRNKC